MSQKKQALWDSIERLGGPVHPTAGPPFLLETASALARWYELFEDSAVPLPWSALFLYPNQILVHEIGIIAWFERHVSPEYSRTIENRINQLRLTFRQQAKVLCSLAPAREKSFAQAEILKGVHRLSVYLWNVWCLENNEMVRTDTNDDVHRELVLDSLDLKILTMLAPGTRLSHYAIEVETRISRKTVGLRLKKMRDSGYTHRPEGDRRGEAITEKGRKVLLRNSPQFTQ